MKNEVPRRLIPIGTVRTPVFQTTRIALREVRADDVDHFYSLFCDARVMRYITDGKVGTREDAAASVARARRNYDLYPGMGKWVAEERSGSRFIGWFSLNYIPGTIDIEIGYWLLPGAWGHGYATEGAASLARHGFDELGLYRIIGVTHPDNLASQRVLQKAGMRDAGWGHYYNRDLRLFVAETSAR